MMKNLAQNPKNGLIKIVQNDLPDVISILCADRIS